VTGRLSDGTWGTSRRPTTPVPPATNTRMTINLPDSRVCLLNQLLVLERLNLK